MSHHVAKKRIAIATIKSLCIALIVFGWLSLFYRANNSYRTKQKAVFASMLRETTVESHDWHPTEIQTKQSMLCALNQGEEEHLLDWIVYHIKIGFDTVVVFMNQPFPYPFLTQNPLVAELIAMRRLELLNKAGDLVKMNAMADCVSIQRSKNISKMLFMDTDEILFDTSGMFDFGSLVGLDHSVYLFNHVFKNTNLMTDPCLLHVDASCGASPWGKTLNDINTVGLCPNPHTCSTETRSQTGTLLDCDAQLGNCTFVDGKWVTFHVMRKSYQHVLYKNNRGYAGDIAYAPRSFDELLTPCSEGIAWNLSRFYDACNVTSRFKHRVHL